MKIKSTKATPAKKSVVKPATKKTPACQKRATVETKPVTFTIHAEKGKNVYLAGEFNQWDPSARKMSYKAKDGLYAVTIKLAAGTYQYKFVIDGTWCADPANAQAVPNDQGTYNSLVTVK